MFRPLVALFGAALWLLFALPLPAAAEDLAVLVSADTVSAREVIRGISAELAPHHILREFPLKDDGDGARSVIERAQSGHPPLIFTVGTQATLLARELVRDIPTVFTLAIDTPAYGLQSTNMTGVNADLDPKTRLALLRELDPDLRRIGVVYKPANSGYFVDQALAAAEPLGLEVVPARIDVKQDIARATRALAGRIDALWMVQDPVLSEPDALRELLKFSLLQNVPVITYSATLVQAGAMLAITPSEEGMGRQAARVAKEILAGKRPGQIPIQSPVSYALALNLRTAKRIGRLEDLAINILIFAAEQKQKIQVFR